MTARYSAVETYADWAVLDQEYEGHPFRGERKAVEYAALLLNAGVPIEDVPQMCGRIACSTCGALMYAGQADADGRCSECQP